MVLKNKLLKQIMRFGVIGCFAAAVNFGIVILLVEGGLLQPLSANAVAFAFAFQVSYFGHRYWTFSDTTAQHRTAVSRLFLLSGTNLFASEGLFYFFMTTFQLPYPIALLCVLFIIPIITFTFTKLWVFR